MGWAIINKLFPFIPRILDKIAERYISKKLEEITGQKKQLDVLKEILVKEVEEKHFWKAEVDKARLEEQQKYVVLINFVINRTFDKINEKYILVPKDTQQNLSHILGARLGRASS